MGFRPRLAYFGAILIVLTLCFCHGSEDGSEKSNLTGIARILASAAETIDVYRNILTDPGVLWRFVESQVYRAKISDLVPTTPLLMLSPALDQYKLALCPRADVNKCMYYGNSSNGLPKQLQGVWWQDGIQFDEELISPVGTWNPKLRRLTITPTNPRNWASHDTSAELAPGGLFWLPSGATHMNGLSCWRANLEIYFNEDVTFGQIYGVGTVLWVIPVFVPAFILDWSMTLLPDGSWARKSTSFLLPTPSGDYTLRSVVTGDGQPGPYYDKWVKSRDGRPFIYFPDR